MSECHRVHYSKSGLLLLGHSVLVLSLLALLHPTKALLALPIYYPPEFVR